ncbi:MAG: GFA family protein [Steroidobacteraceae bacterium]
MTIHGRCLCGSVAFTIDAPLTDMVHCHCSMCRKAHGTQFVTWAAAPLAAFRWSGNTSLIDKVESDGHEARCFCRTCGSSLPIERPSRELVEIPVGLLDEDPGSRPVMHIFVGSKAAAYEIPDALPRHEAFQPGSSGQVVNRPSRHAEAGKVGASCLCGAMAWQVEGTPLMMLNCHCSRCRHARGAAHATNAFYKPAQFSWVQGAELGAHYKVPEAEFFTQDFCTRCGSPTPWVMEKFNRVMLPAGSFDDDPGARATAHIFASSKAPWFEIEDDLPQHEGMVPR